MQGDFNPRFQREFKRRGYIVYWEKYGYEIMVGLCILFLIILVLYNRGKKGTWGKYRLISEKSDLISIPKESKGEIECKRVLEKIFKKPFIKVRPEFLKNPVMMVSNLELDCYNSDLKLAVEYNGIQHYQYVPYFHRTRDAYQNQKYRDYLKKELCEKNNIFLIEVPYTVKHHEIEEYLVTKLKNAGYLS